VLSPLLWCCCEMVNCNYAKGHEGERADGCNSCVYLTAHSTSRKVVYRTSALVASDQVGKTSTTWTLSQTCVRIVCIVRSAVTMLHSSYCWRLSTEHSNPARHQKESSKCRQLWSRATTTRATPRPAMTTSWRRLRSRTLARWGVGVLWGESRLWLKGQAIGKVEGIKGSQAGCCRHSRVLIG
jgi:hypothetical protein